jgi:hypothetical protein
MRSIGPVPAEAQESAPNLAIPQFRISPGSVPSYTALDNVRSQAVMRRLGLRRDNSLDFSAHYDGFGTWRGLVWLATPTPDLTAVSLAARF